MSPDSPPSFRPKLLFSNYCALLAGGGTELVCSPRRNLHIRFVSCVPAPHLDAACWLRFRPSWIAIFNALALDFLPSGILVGGPRPFSLSAQIYYLGRFITAGRVVLPARIRRCPARVHQTISPSTRGAAIRIRSNFDICSCNFIFGGSCVFLCATGSHWCGSSRACLWWAR